MNHRRTPLYNAVKRLVWIFWRPYKIKDDYRLVKENNSIYMYCWKSVMEYKSDYGYYPAWLCRYREKYLAEKDCNNWAFQNLSITGKLIK